ncbi:MAG: HNH endonuclease [Chlorobi bacterium]|nr:HNH endonuclease [Chlorobiota bacterium]
MLNTKLKELPSNSPVILENETCVYCGVQLTNETESKEHVIGRRFVPKGKLSGQWNLIVKACKECNRKKSDLENDLSAITMQADAWGRYAVEDKILMDEALRKAQKSISRRTRKLIKDSSETLKIKVPFAPEVEFNFDLTSPPQAESERVFELARLQLMAFFYFVTYNRQTKRGGFWLGGYFPLLEAARSDWGNSTHISFMKAVVNWEPRFLGIGAEGFFKVIIRRHPSEVCWSWGIEWNQNYRIVGFFGEEKSVREVTNDFPALDVKTLAQNANNFIKYRDEKAISEENDLIFRWETVGVKQ